MDVAGVKVKDAPPEPSTSERLRDAGVEASTSASLTERWRAEIRAQLNLSLPIVASNLLMVSMQMTDLAFIGRVGKDELGAAALGNTVFYLLHYPMIGAMTAVDTLLATAHGASMPAAYGEYTQVGMAFVTACCVPIGACMLFVEDLLRGIEQDPALARLAGAFCKHLAWSLFPYYWTQVLTKYLQAQHVLAPPVYVGIVANGANVFLNWLLIFYLGWGFDGAPIATGACRWFQLTCLFAYLRASRVERARDTNPAGGFFLFVQAACFVPLNPSKPVLKPVPKPNEPTDDDGAWRSKKFEEEDVSARESFEGVGLRLKRNGTRHDAAAARARARVLFPTFGALAGPGAFMMAVEAWAFEITTLLAGYLGTVPLDAHLTMLQLATLAFLSLPFAVAVASTIRVGNLLGAGHPRAAKTAGGVTFLVCFAFTGVVAIVFSVCRDQLGRVFTDDRGVIDAVSKIAPIAALFQLADGGQAAAGGVFRGMGRQKTVAARNFLGFWVFGMPVGATLTFACGVGLAGLWWGLTVGLTVVTLVSLCQLAFVDWERETRDAARRVANETLESARRLSLDGFD
jgi:Na+-driven multidrug efflux pump